MAEQRFLVLQREPSLPSRGAEAGACWECRGSGYRRRKRDPRPQGGGPPAAPRAAATSLGARNQQHVGATHGSLVPSTCGLCPGPWHSAVSPGSPVLHSCRGISRKVNILSRGEKCQGGMGAGVRVVTLHGVAREGHSEEVTFRLGPGRGRGRAKGSEQQGPSRSRSRHQMSQSGDVQKTEE